MSYKHFTRSERNFIEENLKLGYSRRYIAKKLGRHHSSVCDEINRNSDKNGEYIAFHADLEYTKRRVYREYTSKDMEFLIRYVKEKILLTWSPEQIANTPCELKMPSFKTIYRWIYEKYLVDGDVKVLRKKGKTRKRLGNGGRFTTGKSIRKRDKSVYKRKEFGHWEADTVVSGQGKTKYCFATLAERTTRYYIAVKIPNRSAATMAKAIIQTLAEFPKEAVKSITCDRGSEFANWREIESALDCNMYFADPYCAWQKGTNENLNGLLREFYPKGKNLERVSPVTLKKNLALINARPKKVLNYRKPIDLFNEFLSKCCT